MGKEDRERYYQMFEAPNPFITQCYLAEFSRQYGGNAMDDVLRGKPYYRHVQHGGSAAVFRGEPYFRRERHLLAGRGRNRKQIFGIRRTYYPQHGRGWFLNFLKTAGRFLLPIVAKGGLAAASQAVASKSQGKSWRDTGKDVLRSMGSTVTNEANEQIQQRLSGQSGGRKRRRHRHGKVYKGARGKKHQHHKRRHFVTEKNFKKFNF